MKVAGRLIESRKKLLKACVKKMKQLVLIYDQEKIEIGLKRKAKLSSYLEILKKKKKYLVNV